MMKRREELHTQEAVRRARLDVEQQLKAQKISPKQAAAQIAALDARKRELERRV